MFVDVVDHIKLILQELRPAIVQDGGDVHFVRFENGVLFVKLDGACVTCPISFITLKMGLETQIKQRIPEVKSVVSIDQE